MLFCETVTSSENFQHHSAYMERLGNKCRMRQINLGRFQPKVRKIWSCPGSVTESIHPHHLCQSDAYDIEHQYLISGRLFTRRRLDIFRTVHEMSCPLIVTSPLDFPLVQTSSDTFLSRRFRRPAAFRTRTYTESIK